MSKSENFKTNKGVIEAWLNNFNDSGHNARKSIFFEGNTIYSYGYHFPLAHKVNGNIVEITWEERYSVTTSRHQSMVLHATSKRGKEVVLLGKDRWAGSFIAENGNVIKSAKTGW